MLWTCTTSGRLPARCSARDLRAPARATLRTASAGLPGQRPLGDLVAVPLEQRDLVPRAAQRGRLLVDDGVLTAGGGGAVAVVDHQDLHRRTSSAGAASSEAATARSSRYGEASPRPVSVIDATRQ